MGRFSDGNRGFKATININTKHRRGEAIRKFDKVPRTFSLKE